jgi:hypothetical protein
MGLELVEPEPSAADMARKLLRNLRGQPIGTKWTYSDLFRILDRDPQSDWRARSAILKARRELLREENKYLGNVRRVGYEIIQPSEHTLVASHYRRSSVRKLAKAFEVTVRVDLSGLSAKQLEALTVEQARAGVLLSFARRVGRRRQLSGLVVRPHLPAGQELVQILVRPLPAKEEP